MLTALPPRPHRALFPVTIAILPVVEMLTAQALHDPA
jgi:hypothetical protein